MSFMNYTNQNELLQGNLSVPQAVDDVKIAILSSPNDPCELALHDEKHQMNSVQNRLFNILNRTSRSKQQQLRCTTAADTPQMMNDDLSEFSPFKKKNQMANRTFDEPVLPQMHAVTHREERQQQFRDTVRRKNRFKIMTLVCDEVTQIENYTVLNTEVEELQRKQEHCMNTVQQRYQPKQCLPIRPFEPENQYASTQQTPFQCVFSPRLKVRKGTKVQILKNLNFRKAPSKQAQQSPKKSRTSVSPKTSVIAHRKNTVQSNKQQSPVRQSRRQRDSLHQNATFTSDTIYSLPSSAHVSQDNSPRRKYSVVNSEQSTKQQTHHTTMTFDSEKTGSWKRASTTKAGFRKKKAQKESNSLAPVQAVRPPEEQITPRNLNEQPNIVTSREYPKDNMSFIVNNSVRRRINKRFSSHFDPKVQIHKRRSPFNSTEEINENASDLSIKRYFIPNVGSTKAAGTSPMEQAERSPDTQNGMQEQPQKSLFKLEDTNRDFRKRLSEFVIKRNQRLTNSRYTSMIEAVHQERPSKRTYFFDPTFNYQLQQMNLELQAIISENQRKSLEELTARQMVANIESQTTPISAVSTANDQSSAMKARIDTE